MSPTAHTVKHTGLMLVGPPGYSWVCSQLTSRCYGNTESPWSRGRRTLQQCLGGNTAARLCSKSDKSQLKVPWSKVGNDSPSHEECEFWQLQSGTKRIEVTPVASGQWLLSKECAVRASPCGVPQGPALPSHAGRTSLRDTDLHPGKTELITLKSAIETPLIMPLLAIPEQASTLLSASSTIFLVLLFCIITQRKEKTSYKKIPLKFEDSCWMHFAADVIFLLWPWPTAICILL